MKIEFHDLRSQYITYQEEINAAIQQVLDSCHFIMGEEVFSFENELAAYLNCRNVITCASGTDALLLALMAIDIQPGDEVITTPFSFIAPAEVTALLQAKPVFADISADIYTLNPEKIAEKITAKTRAIIPVSLYGQPADMDEINEIAKVYSHKFGRKIYVIEDAAQSLGAEYKGKKSATLGDIGCTSFFPTKPLGCYGDGGAVILNDDELVEKIKSLRVHGQVKRYSHQYIGFNCRLDTLQAAILRVKLKYFDKEIKIRWQIAERYRLLCAKLGVGLPIVKADRSSVYAQYSLRFANRAQMIESLKARNIPIAIHYPQPIHLQSCFKNLGYRPGSYPIAEKISNEIISLPMSAFLTEAQQKYIVQALEESINQKAVEEIT